MEKNRLLVASVKRDILEKVFEGKGEWVFEWVGGIRSSYEHSTTTPTGDAFLTSGIPAKSH